LHTWAVSAQTILQCRQRFDQYLNFNGALNGLVKFEDNALFLLDASGKKEIAVYADEVAVLAGFFENSSVKQQQELVKRKGTRRFRQNERDSISATTNSKELSKGASLSGVRIAIDPGHFGTTLAEAAVEQKFLYFVKDPLKFPQDTIKLFESTLTFNTAVILQRMLRESGAITFVTRDQANHTSFNCSFADWMKKNKKRTLDSLVKEKVIEPARYRKLLSCNDYQFFWDFFRDLDLANRAKKVNEFNPHLTLIIHYNVDEKNHPWKSHSAKNFTMAFIAGGFTYRDLLKSENRMHFLRLLLTNQLNRSEELAAQTVKRFRENLGIPVATARDATYLKKNSISTNSPGVFCRNLILCRKINSPLVYGESLYQDNETECELLMKCDLDIYGIKANERLKKVALSYYEAVNEYLKKE
jgi:N-acetylmuramoyl-L-alanine amidase